MSKYVEKPLRRDNHRVHFNARLDHLGTGLIEEQRSCIKTKY